MQPTIRDIDKRLQERYQRLVQEHSGHAHAAASGPRLLPTQKSPQAGAMAAWRFYDNPRTTFPRLTEPLLQAATQAAAHCQDFALVDMDWSWLDYRHHPSKIDLLQGPEGVRGYKL